LWSGYLVNMRIFENFASLLKSKYGIWFFLASVVMIQAIFVYCVSNGFFNLDKYYAMGRFYILLILALSFTFVCAGFSGVVDLFRSMLVWRVAIGWYFFAIFYLIIIAFGILVFMNMMDGEALKSIPLDLTLFERPRWIYGIVLNSVVEEVVWVSLVLTVLQKRFSVFVSSQILAVFWFLWWVPVILYGRAVIPDLPLSILWFHYLGIAATCAWVYHFTKSGLIVVLMQIVTNAISMVVPILPHLSDFNTYAIFIFGKFAFIVLMFAIFGPKPIFRRVRNEAKAA